MMMVSDHTGCEISQREFALEQIVEEMLRAIEGHDIKDNSYEGNHCGRLKQAAEEVLAMVDEEEGDQK